MSTDLLSLSVTELRASLSSGKVSPVEVIEALEQRISEKDPVIGAYLSRDFETARKTAEKADVTLPLGGIPIGIKDAISVCGESCTAASKILRGYCAPYDATVITRLRAAGAIPFGRMNMDEFAMGSSTETSAYQLTRNPHDSDYTPGGSSGGSAAAVAAYEAYATLGSDTGGSIRQPASYSGCVGLKPSYGRVSRYGLIAFASSLDQIGPLTRTTRDAALILNAIAGKDPRDSTSLALPTEDFTASIGKDIKGMRLGVPKEYFIKGIDPAVESAVRQAIAQMETLGAEIVEVSLPHTEYAVSVYYLIAAAEASSNLARFDGVRYGYRAENPVDLIDHYTRTREEGFGSEVKRRIILGTYVLSSGYYDAYYLHAQKVRTLIRNDFDAAFKKVDALISPTTPVPAFRIGEKTGNPLHMYLNDIFTTAANLAGICAISLPCGWASTPQGTQLPIGVQILGKANDEGRILQIGHAYETARGPFVK